ncbi:MAG: Ig-like domain-containing protein [Agarilytica sp.]
MLISMFTRKKSSLKISAFLLVSTLFSCGGGESGGNSSPRAEITLDSITGDDSISASEAMGVVSIAGSTGGDVAGGDIVTLTVSDKSYSGVVTANRFSIDVPGAELVLTNELAVRVTIQVDGEEITAEVVRTYSVAPPVVSISLNSSIAGDNIVNLVESQQDISIGGSVEGDIFDGDRVIVVVANETYEGSVSDGAFDIAVPGSSLINVSELAASIETNTGSSLGEATDSDSLTYTVSIQPPQISVVFPWDEVVVESSVTTITAVIVDDGEISEVLINGSLAQDITDTTSIPELDRERLANVGSDVMVVSLEVALPIGETTISMVASDSVGNVAGPQISTITRIVDQPNYLFDDSENNRFIGPIPGFERSSAWVGIDKNSLQIEGLSPLSVLGSAYDVYPGSGVIYGVETNSIIETSLDAFTSSVLASFDETLIPEGWELTGLFDVHLNESGTILYIMQMLIPPENEDGGWQPIFYAYDITLDQISVLSSVFDGEDSIFGTKFAYGGDYLLASISSRNRNSSNELIKINLNDGSKEVVVSDLGFFATELTIDQENNTVYVIGLGDADSAAVDLDTYVVTSIPTSDDDSLIFALPQPTDVVLDSENGRLLVGDSDLPYVTTIDIATGVRGSLTDDGRVGEGVAIAMPSDIYVTEDQSKAYVLDGGNNQLQRLLSVDITTGDRSVVSTFTPGVSLGDLSLSIDEENAVAYVVHNNSVYLVNLENGGKVVIASSSIGTGVDVSSIQAVARTGNDSELVVAYDDGEILNLNTVTLHRTYLASTGLDGAIRDLEYDASNNRIFITTNNAGVFTFTLQNNELSVLLSECLDALGENWLTSHGYVKNADYNVLNNKLLLAGPEYLGAYAEVELSDMSCNVYSSSSFEDGKYLSSGDILGVRKNEMIVIGSSTHGVAILSK